MLIIHLLDSMGTGDQSVHDNMARMYRMQRDRNMQMTDAMHLCGNDLGRVSCEQHRLAL